MIEKGDLFVSTPCYGGHCTNKYAASILKLQNEALKRKLVMRLDTTENESLITRARNMSVARFLQNTDCPYLLFIDADIHFQPETVFQAIDADEDIVVSPYPKKVIRWNRGELELKKGGKKPMDRVTSDLVINIVGNVLTVEKDNFVNVHDGATGFMLIKRQVFYDMMEKYPELKCKNDHPDMPIDEYYAFFECMIDPDNKRYLSEDYAFCRRWQLMGKKIKMNINSTLGHIGMVPFVFNLKNRLRTLHDRHNK